MLVEMYIVRSCQLKTNQLYFRIESRVDWLSIGAVVALINRKFADCCRFPEIFDDTGLVGVFDLKLFHLIFSFVVFLYIIVNDYTCHLSFFLFAIIRRIGLSAGRNYIFDRRSQI